MEAFAVVSSFAPNQKYAKDIKEPVLAALSVERDGAEQEASRLRNQVFVELGKVGSVHEDHVAAMLAYRRSIRVVPITLTGL